MDSKSKGISFADLTHLIERYQELITGVEVLENRRREVEAEVEKKKLASQYESIAAYVMAATELKEAKAAVEEAKMAENQVRSECKAVEKQIMGFLPSCVWIRFGEIGVGVSWTNWGGGESSLMIQPWQAEMPPLRHIVND